MSAIRSTKQGPLQRLVEIVSSRSRPLESSLGVGLFPTAQSNLQWTPTYDLNTTDSSLTPILISFSFQLSCHDQIYRVKSLVYRRRRLRTKKEHRVYRESNEDAALSEIKQFENQPAASHSSKKDAQISDLVTKLDLLQRRPFEEADNLKVDFKAFLESSSIEQIRLLFSGWTVINLPEQTWIDLCNFVFTECEQLLTHQLSILLVQHAVFPKIERLESLPSRSLQFTVASIAISKPNAVLHGLILPLLSDCELNFQHTEFLLRLFKESNFNQNDRCKLILRTLTSASLPQMPQKYVNRTNHLTILEFVLSQCSSLDTDLILDIVRLFWDWIETEDKIQSDEGTEEAKRCEKKESLKNVKLLKILLSLMKRFTGSMNQEILNSVKSIADQTNSVMTKTVLKEVKKLETRLMSS
ncbi:hypothetical protein BKA69DRAFT_1123037 [Paraphysoderma sedebokerense]|nr:hypothetical protein BKA69DRAFT_1123037 [Paraphysoderma sedebokerense]